MSLKPTSPNNLTFNITLEVYRLPQPSLRLCQPNKVIKHDSTVNSFVHFTALITLQAIIGQRCLQSNIIKPKDKSWPQSSSPNFLFIYQLTRSKLQCKRTFTHTQKYIYKYININLTFSIVHFKWKHCVDSDRNSSIANPNDLHNWTITITTTDRMKWT